MDAIDAAGLQQTLGLLGLELPSPVYIAGAIIFGVIGWLLFRRGRRDQRPRTWGIGLALMLFPYLVTGSGWLYTIGVALCAAAWLERG